MDRREFLATGAVALGTAVAGCVGSDGIDYDVAMVSDGFLPQSTASVPADAPKWIPRTAPTVEVRAGDELVWENTGSRIHTVTAATRHHPHARAIIGSANENPPEDATPRLPDGVPFYSSGEFRSEIEAVRSFIQNLNGGGAIPPGEQYRHTFDTPGWYHYYCIPHEPAGMMGNVHVLPP